LIDDFKTFLFRGNIIDLAVAVIIGAAFAAIVTAFSTGMITPLIGMILSKDFTEMYFTINGSRFQYGLVIDATIRFVSTAAVLFFVVVKPVQAMAARRAAGETEEELPPTEADLLIEIRDLLKQQQAG
jgi:large conductance mechanosensitive channel